MGNGSLPVQINRRFSMTANQPFAGDQLYPELFGSMALDIPRIEITKATNDNFCKGLYFVAKQPAELTIKSNILPKYHTAAEEGGEEAPIDRDLSDDKYNPFTSNQSHMLLSGIVFYDNNKKVHFYPKEHSLNNGRFPNNADYVSPDNWYINCDGNSFNVHKPNGTIYELNTYETRLTGNLHEYNDIYNNF